MALLYSKHGSQFCQSPFSSQDFCMICELCEFKLLLEGEFMCSFWAYTIKIGFHITIQNMLKISLSEIIIAVT